MSYVGDFKSEGSLVLAIISKRVQDKTLPWPFSLVVRERMRGHFPILDREQILEVYSPVTHTTPELTLAQTLFLME